MSLTSFGVREFITALALPQVDINREFHVTTAYRTKDILHRTPTPLNGNRPEALPTWLLPSGFPCAAVRTLDQSSENSKHSKEAS